ncbi:MAG TPA: peptidyl-prolyl cis-trans isomerase [Gammaproteobacteria bacterium]|nr:peptidyl-prolyl cis-trans isomerase [Gammaproteobacteria bacterium]
MRVTLRLLLSLFFFTLMSGCNAMTQSKNPKVTLETSMGNIVLELYPDKAPKTVENFIAYVKDGHYDGVIFHRVIPNFMIQGGGMTEDMQEKPTRAPIENEANNGLKNDEGTIAMARTSDPHSATAQFFINVKNNDFLNFSAPTPQGWGYAVFGKVVEGMDVVHKIEKVQTGNRAGHQDVPLDPVIITKATVSE